MITNYDTCNTNCISISEKIKCNFDYIYGTFINNDRDSHKIVYKKKNSSERTIYGWHESQKFLNHLINKFEKSGN